MFTDEKVHETYLVYIEKAVQWWIIAVILCSLIVAMKKNDNTVAV